MVGSGSGISSLSGEGGDCLSFATSTFSICSQSADDLVMVGRGVRVHNPAVDGFARVCGNTSPIAFGLAGYFASSVGRRHSCLPPLTANAVDLIAVHTDHWCRPDPGRFPAFGAPEHCELSVGGGYLDDYHPPASAGGDRRCFETESKRVLSPGVDERC